MSLGEGICAETVFVNALDPRPILLALRMSDVAGGKVTVVLVTVEA